jgi:hypothetical protein
MQGRGTPRWLLEIRQYWAAVARGAGDEAGGPEPSPRDGPRSEAEPELAGEAPEDRPAED